MKVLISGGGTAGHINPGIAIAKYIKYKNPDAEILFIGTKKGLETNLVPREGFKLETIRVRGFKRKLSKDTFVAVKELFQGMLEARRIIKKFKPDIVIGTGGYVCGPVVFNASTMKIPTLIHEQNAFPGVTNKILSRFTKAVAISFKESKDYFPSSKKLTLTGNPIRMEILEAERAKSRKKLGIDNETPVVVISGGSRGAESVNDTVAEMILNYLRPEDCRLIFATGEALFESINNKLKDKKPATVEVVPYIYDMANAMAASDLAVCRAGAITIAELTALGVPSILIPSPYVTANHQEYNARALEKEGGAVVILEKELDAQLLYQQIKSLLNDRDTLLKMSRNSKKVGITNAAEKIYSLVLEIMKKEHNN